MSESQKRGGQGDNEEGGGSASKRLKSSEPDLSIVCRFDGKNETIQVHSVIMANHSNYFDTLLASGMEESETKTVTLDDVDPSLFRSAFEIFEDPLQSASATAQEIMKAAPIYNRFEFSKGLKLAEAILVKFLEDWTKKKGKSPSRREKKLLGDSILFSQDANLEDLTQKSISFIKEKLRKGSSATDVAIFDQSFIQKILPFLEEHRAACLTDLYSRRFPNSFQERLGAADCLVHLHWLTSANVARKQLVPLGLKIVCRVNLGGDRATFDLQPYQWTTGHLEDGQEISCFVGRIRNEGCRSQLDDNGEIGDWFANIKVGHGTRGNNKFVWPSSKSFPLPPFGKQWTLVSEGDEGDSNVEQKATFEVVSAKAN